MADWVVLKERLVNLEDILEEIITLEGVPEDNTVNSGTVFGFIGSDSPTPSKTRFAVTFLDAFKNTVVGNRGTFSYQYLEMIRPRRSDGTLIQEQVTLIDSIEFHNAIGYRGILTPSLSDGQLITVRLFNVEPPDGAVFYRVYYREVI